MLFSNKMDSEYSSLLMYIEKIDCNCCDFEYLNNKFCKFKEHWQNKDPLICFFCIVNISKLLFEKDILVFEDIIVRKN